ncbi:MAG TPA: ribose 5-phosphate isomerase B [Bacteroidetes bacterium]|nr:ribose 5-phosphate isomerase B [Bacteroidota bacterium]
MKIKIALASDHAGYYLKEKIKKYLIDSGYEIKDFGCHSPDNVDYPDFIHPAARVVESGQFDMGFTVCGSGNGMSMTANKYPGIRCALCWNEETSKLARAHNNANICSLPGRFISDAEAQVIVKTFLETDFEGGRHKRRIEKIPLKRV